MTLNRFITLKSQDFEDLRTVNCVYLTILSLATITCVREETVLQGMTDFRLAEVEMCHGMETNVKISTVKRLSRQPSPIQTTTDQKLLENVRFFKCFGNLLIPWCTVIFENLTGLQLVKKFPAFHGTRRFITVLTSVRHLFLSWASPIQSIYPHPTSWISIQILSTHLG